MLGQNSILKKLINPFTGSIGLLGIIVVRAALSAAGIEYANVLYALIPGPIAILAHSGGMLLVVAASVATVLADIFAASLGAGGEAAAGAHVTIGALEKFVMMCTCGAVVYYMSSRLSQAVRKASRQAKDYRKELYLQEKKSASALSNARSRERQVKHDVTMYSSLVLLLEEAAEKIYSSLDPEDLIHRFFVVLRKGLRAETGAVYFIDEQGKNYTLHASFGYGPERPYDQPEVVPASDPLVQYVAAAKRAIALYDGAPPDPQVRSVAPKSILSVKMSVALLVQSTPTGIVTINSFSNDAQPDFTRDTALLSMLCNIASIAFTNARLFMRIQDMADRDPLTKLFNRRYFYEALSREVSKGHLQKTTACVLLCDIDHFKTVNDTHGHQAGDTVLIDFARTCSSIIRDCDVLARYGGEEFVFLLPGLSAEAGRQAGQRIRRAIAEKEFNVEGIKLHITTSCGVAAFPEHASDVAALIKAADLALYDAKAAGRNAVVVAGGPASESLSCEGTVSETGRDAEDPSTDQADAPTSEAACARLIEQPDD